MFKRRPLRMVAGVVFSVALLSLLGGGIAGADSSAVGWGWASLGSPLPLGGIGGADLNAISCPDASTCAAVGQYGDASGWHGLLLDGAGGAWKATKINPPADWLKDDFGVAPHFYSVSCVSAKSCAAVGEYPTSGSDYAPMLAVKVGRRWRSAAVSAPALSDGPAAGNVPYGPYSGPFPPYGDRRPLPLEKVSCAQICAAVGEYRWGTVHTSVGWRDSTEGLLVVGSGDGQWASLTAPLPGDANSAGPDGLLRDVSCVGTECVAGGSYLDGSGQERALLLTDSNGTWTAAPAPLPANAASTNQDAKVEAISCPAAGKCSAAGSYLDSAGARQALLLTETGGTWSAIEGTLPARPPADPGVRFTALSCSQPGECAAVGWDVGDPFGGESLPLAVAERNGIWDAAVNPALPSDAAPLATSRALGGIQYSLLNTVSCSSPGHCDAGGVYYMKNEDGHPLLAELNGTTWTGAGLPLPTDALSTTFGDSAQGATVRGISCVDPVGCEGVGAYNGPLGRMDHALIVLNGNPMSGVAEAKRATTKGGTASVRVSCIGQTPCKVTFILRTKDRRTVIGTATGTVAAHGTAVIPFVLNARGKLLLKRTPKRSKLASFLNVTERNLVVSNQKPSFKRS